MKNHRTNQMKTMLLQVGIPGVILFSSLLMVPGCASPSTKAETEPLAWDKPQIIQPRLRGGEDDRKTIYSPSDLQGFSADIRRAVDQKYRQKGRNGDEIEWVQPKKQKWIMNTTVQELPDGSFSVEIVARLNTDERQRKRWNFRFYDPANFRQKVNECTVRIVEELSTPQPPSDSSASRY